MKLSWKVTGKINSPLQWRHNGRDGVSNHHCLLNRLFRRRSKKTSTLPVTGLYARNSPVTVNSPHKWPVTRKMFPFDDVIMVATSYNHNKTPQSTKVCVFLGLHCILTYHPWVGWPHFLTRPIVNIDVNKIDIWRVEYRFSRVCVTIVASCSASVPSSTINCDVISRS